MSNNVTLMQNHNGLSANPATRNFSLAALLKSTSFVIAARTSGAAFGVLSQFFLAKLFSAEEIGLFFVTTGFAMVLAVICTLGYPMLVAQIAAEAKSTRNSFLLAHFMARARADTMHISAALIFCMLLAICFVSSISLRLQQILFFTALMFPTFALLRLNGSLANAQKRFELGFLPDLFFRPLLLLVFIGVMWLNWGKLSLYIIFIGQIVIGAFLAFWQMYWISGTPKSFDALLGFSEKPRRELTNYWRRRAFPLMAGALFIGVFADLDIVIARLFLDDAQTGIFGLTLKISLFAAFAIQAIHQIVLRDIADALHAVDNCQLHRVIARANALTLIGSVGAALFVMVFGKEVLGFFGEEFKAGFDCLIILMVAQVARAAAGPAVHILALSGHEKSCLPVFLFCLVLLPLGNLVLIGWAGLLGAAVTVLIVSALWSFWLAGIAKSKLGLKTNVVFA